MKELHGSDGMESVECGAVKNMKIQIQQKQIAGMSCDLFLPDDYDDRNRYYPVIYINGEVPIEEIIAEVKKSGNEADFILLCICPKSWNDDFTPWSASAFRKGEDAPSGRADAYISCLTEEIKPYVDSNYRTRPEPEHTILFGYSLGGLAALYTVYKTDVFGVVGSLSGSLWYDNFCEYMEQARPLRQDLRVYLSLGTKEKLSRNPRMSKVEQCTKKAQEILTRQLDLQDSHRNMLNEQTDGSNSMSGGQQNAERVRFEWNEGGHFHDITKRFAKAVVWWILSERQEN